MNTRFLPVIGLLLLFSFCLPLSAQTAMVNSYGREGLSLNGKWDANIDLYDKAQERGFANAKPSNDSRFVEFSFDGGMRLDVPGDFNSQRKELLYYESVIWYKKDFTINKKADKRYFLHFGAVNYLAEVAINGKRLGSHEGGFFPFQFEVTDKLKNGENFVVVKVNNARREDYIPTLVFDWWNYGGITRDVKLIETPKTYLYDYTIQLAKNSMTKVEVAVKLDGATTTESVEIEIPEAKIKQTVKTNEKGEGKLSFDAKLQLWSPQEPKLYQIQIKTPYETIKEKIGFRTIQTKGEDILLNGKSVYLTGINVHDEIPMREGRSYTEADAAMLLREVKALGCNFMRLTHYPANEIMVRMAEEMGIMMWEEIPTWQRIMFSNPRTVKLGEQMIREMIQRDKNRCAIIIWSVANETKRSPERDAALIKYVDLVRSLDDTRLVSAAFDNTKYNSETKTVTLEDPVADKLDIVSVNKYFGWYQPWPVKPEEIKWEVGRGRPFIYSEMGCEAMYGQEGSPTVAHSWGELYQEKYYKDHILMFPNIPNMRGLTPWVLYDFKSPYRMHQRHQNEWNRKGIISDKGFYKKAWYVLRDYYTDKNKEYISTQNKNIRK